MFKKSIFGIILPGFYSLLVLAALVFMFATARQSAFCGVYALLITLPWSMFFVFILNTIAPTVFNSMIPGTIIICFSAAINIGLLYFIGVSIDRRFN